MMSSKVVNTVLPCFLLFTSFFQLISLDDAPTFLETFKARTMEPGPPLSLKCVASGNPLPQVTWLLDGFPVPDDFRFRTGDYVTRNGLLVSYVNISTVTTMDGGLYKCTASNDVASVKHSARINIFGPPYIRHMKNVSAVAGETMVLHCPAGGHPIEHIYWERENLRLPYNHRQKVFSNGTLVVSDVERATDEGKYKCVVRNQEGKSAHSSLFVLVLVKPVIDPFQFSTSLHQGQRYNVLCSVTKGDPPITITWLRDGNTIPFGSNKRNSFRGINVVPVGEFSSTLSFDSLGPEHSGNYTCLARNIAGTASHNASMVIHVQPRWRIEPTDSAVVRGRTLIIDCQADGFPPPRIRWSKGEGFLQTSPSDFKAITSNPHLRVFENGSLAVQSAQKSDAGFYLCQASNGIGSGLSKVLKLNVHVAAHFESKFRAETVRRGHEVRLKCESFGDKPLTIIWLKDKLPFSPKEDPRYELIEADLAEGLTSEVVIRNADRRDSALFTCITTNPFGQDDTNIQLIMQEAPDAPQDVKVFEVDGRSAKLSWSPPYGGNSPILHYIIQHKTEEEKFGPRSFNFTIPGSETFFHLRNLQPVTTYELRIFATNAIGRSEPSSLVQFKTDEEAPGGPPLHIKAYPMTSSSIRVSWKPPKKDLHHGTIKGYYVGYKVAGGPNADDTSKSGESTFIYKTLEVKNGDFVEECHLTSLKRFTKYAITVQAYNSKGAGPTAEDVFAVTLQNDPPPSPTLKAASATVNSIDLSWSLKPEEDNVAAPVTDFLLYKKVADTESWEEFRLTGDRNQHTVEGLRCGTRYQFYLIAVNSIGKSDPSDIIGTKTEGMAPIPPDKNSLLSINSSSAVIHLDAWHDGGCTINSVEIMYKGQKSRVWSTIPGTVDFLDEKDIILTNLSPSTSYDLKITAYNDAGPTEAQYSFTTSHLSKDTVAVIGKGVPSTSASFYSEFTLLLPTSVSVVIIAVAVMLLCVILTKKREPNPALYESTGIYGTSKCQESSGEALRLSDMDQAQVKKLCSDTSSGPADSGYYPSPYATTKVTGGERGRPMLNTSTNTHSNSNSLPHTSPLKMRNGLEGEPLYATVKRTPRPPRPDVHEYHHPASILNSMGDAQSWKSMATTGMATPGNTEYNVFMKIEEEPSEKLLLEAPPCSSTVYIYDENHLGSLASRRLSQLYPRT